MAEGLGKINKFSAAVVALSGIALGILAVHHRGKCLEDCLRAMIFTGNEVEPLSLSTLLTLDDVAHLGINFGKWSVKLLHLRVAEARSHQQPTEHANILEDILK